MREFWKQFKKDSEFGAYLFAFFVFLTFLWAIYAAIVII